MPGERLLGPAPAARAPPVVAGRTPAWRRSSAGTTAGPDRGVDDQGEAHVERPAADLGALAAAAPARQQPDQQDQGRPDHEGRKGHLRQRAQAHRQACCQHQPAAAEQLRARERPQREASQGRRRKSTSVSCWRPTRIGIPATRTMATKRASHDRLRVHATSPAATYRTGAIAAFSQRPTEGSLPAIAITGIAAARTAVLGQGRGRSSRRARLSTAGVDGLVVLDRHAEIGRLVEGRGRPVEEDPYGVRPCRGNCDQDGEPPLGVPRGAHGMKIAAFSRAVLCSR